VKKILEHKHLIVRAEVKNPPKDPTLMDAWMSNMVEAIGMKILDGPRSIYSDMEGNRGLTSSVILNTSNAVVHTWDECEPALFQCDIYSCGFLDPNIIFGLLSVFEFLPTLMGVIG
jgi:S-adenosylmethionine/arginine decarboxylase-like enzyme